MFRLCIIALLLTIAQAFVLKNQRFISSSSTTSVTKKFLFGNPDPSKQSPAPKKDGGGGLFGGMGNMMDTMKKAQEIAKQAQELNKELAETPFIGNDPSMQVYATFNGLGAPISIKMSDEICSKGGEAVSMAATQAMADAYAKAQQAMITKMQAIYGGVPGMPGK